MRWRGQTGKGHRAGGGRGEGRSQAQVRETVAKTWLNLKTRVEVRVRSIAVYAQCSLSVYWLSGGQRIGRAIQRKRESLCSHLGSGSRAGGEGCQGDGTRPIPLRVAWALGHHSPGLPSAAPLFPHAQARKELLCYYQTATAPQRRP